MRYRFPLHEVVFYHECMRSLDIMELYHPDRVLRQFRHVQTILLDPFVPQIIRRYHTDSQYKVLWDILGRYLQFETVMCWKRVIMVDWPTRHASVHRIIWSSTVKFLILLYKVLSFILHIQVSYCGCHLPLGSDHDCIQFVRANGTEIGAGDDSLTTDYKMPHV